MIPHIWELLRFPPRDRDAPSKRTKPGRAASCVGGRSTELSTNESRDPTTEPGRFLLRGGFGENPNQRFGARGPDQDPPRSVQLGVQPLDLLAKLERKLSHAGRNVLLHLDERRHHRRRLCERPPLERPAEKQRRGEAVAGDMAVEADDVARLLAAEDRA